MKVSLVDPDPQWPAAFSEERDRLFAVLGDSATHIDHIGSTAVPGLTAKPVIDVQVGVTNLARFDKDSQTQKLEETGYNYFPQYEELMPFRRFFARDVDGERYSNVHIVSADHPWFQRHIIFRDYLRANELARDRYAEAKRELAARDWDSTNDYAGAKTNIVLALEEEAFQHFRLPEAIRAWLRTSRAE